MKYDWVMTKRELGIIAAGILGSSTVMLGESVVNLGLPSVARAFGGSFATLQWVVDGYNLALASLILLGGSLGDSLGLRRMFLWSGAAFIVLSLLCALAWSAVSLILLRTLLGVAGALLTPVALAVLNAQLPEHLRSRAIGYWTAATSIVLALGPLVGGLLVDAFSWRAIFLANLPLGIVAFTLAYLYFNKDAARAKAHVDWTGVVLGAVSLAGITYGLIEGPNGWTVYTVGALVAGAVCLVLFVLWERHAN